MQYTTEKYLGIRSGSWNGSTACAKWALRSCKGDYPREKRTPLFWLSIGEVVLQCEYSKLYNTRATETCWLNLNFEQLTTCSSCCTRPLPPPLPRAGEPSHHQNSSILGYDVIPGLCNVFRAMIKKTFAADKLRISSRAERAGAEEG